MSSGPRSRKRRRTNKLGRNDPCFCGSEVKYKKCCLPKGLKPSKLSGVSQKFMDEHTQAASKREQFLQSKGIYINLPNTITFKGKSFLAAGNKVMWDNNPHATFHELILRNLSQALGQEWWDAENAKSPEEKHYIKQCYEELKGSDNRDDLDVQQVDEHTRKMLATGNTQALISLAFDVWLLTHKGCMCDEWLERLRERKAYQGVRYEIGVASLFVRMGCELEFYDPNERDEKGKQPKRAEFIAIHPPTGNRIAIEAKSRHVDGVIHTPGTMNYRRALKGDITALYKKALLKKTDGLPLIVFIDVNSPTETGQTTQNTQWFADVKRSFDSRPAASPANPDEYAAVFITNFSPHYQGSDISHHGQYLFIYSMHPHYPLAGGYQGDFVQRLIRAINNYGYVPPSMDNSKISVYESPVISSKENFIDKLRKLTMPKEGDPEYARKKAESGNLINMLVWDVIQKSGGDWNNEIASECLKQFEWLYIQP